MQKQVPDEFVEIYEKYKQLDKLSLNVLSKYFSVSQPVIKRWLHEKNLQIEIKNKYKESDIDLCSFKNDVSSGIYTIKEISEKYNLSTKNIKHICKRQNIVLNTKSSSFEPENKQELIDYILKYGKQKAAKKYNVSLAIIINWCKKHHVKVTPYNGIKRNDLQNYIEEIKKLYYANYSLYSIAKLFNTSNQAIKRYLVKNGVEIITQFDKWERDKQFINSNIYLYEHENKKNGLNLAQIAEKYNISYEVLKKQFAENNIEVQLFSYNKSRGELEVKEFMESLGITCKSIRRKYNDKIFEIDCFSEKHNFGIEYCGEFWHSHKIGKDKNYHQNKFLWAKEQNIQLMTIFEHEWILKKDLIKSMIKCRLNLCDNKIFARNTEILIISNKQAKEFHDYNHMNNGLKNTTLNIGLFFKNELVSVASFSKSRFNKNFENELIRFSTKRNTIVVGGFSKILKYYNEITDNKSLFTYCDLRFGVGNVYLKSDFTFEGITPPNYWYYFKKDGSQGCFESRMKYQKKNLTHYNNYSDEKTEFEIMSENGFLKIYDCGNYKFSYKGKN